MDRILVIDDEYGPRESLRMLLKHRYHIECVDSVDAGLQLMKVYRPDLVILDIQMPERSGLDGLRAIRTIDKEVAVVMLTAYSTLNRAQEALRLDANDYITKPFDIDDMQQVIHRNIRESQFRRKRTAASVELHQQKRQLERELNTARLMSSFQDADRMGVMSE